jgi:AcrR family transcriptional regulator
MKVAGLRERKKQKTKASIQREALRLFKRHGYDETTIEDIAEAAEISPSTYFNYFPTKEDVVIYDEYDPQVFAALTEHVEGESLAQSLKRVIGTLGGLFESDRDGIYERAKLSLEVPELRARIWEELERARDLFATILAGRTGRDTSDFEIRVISMALVAAAFEASMEWVRQGGKGSMLDLFERAMGTVGLYALLDRLESGASLSPIGERVGVRADLS